MTTKATPASVTSTDGHNGNDWRAANVSRGKYSTKRPKTQSPTPDRQSMLAWAIRYANNGYPVFPLVPGGKGPAIASAHPDGDPLRGVCKGECGKQGHGVHDATTALETIADWWRKWPTANIGLALDNAHVVLDVDPRNGGKLGDLYKLGVDVDATPTQRTWSGGWHVLLKKPVSVAFHGKVPGVPGVDIKTAGGYIVAAPSVIDGKPYTWERDPFDVDPARIPLDLAERLTKRSPAARTDAQDGPRTAHSVQAGRYDPATVKSMLDVLPPWSFGYDTWVSILMAVHSALGDDGLELAEQWGEGKPGEIAAKFASFDAAGGVTFATLVYHAKQAGWQPAAAADETDLPAAWRITPDDWRACPVCAALHTDRYSDNSLVHHHNWCRRPACPVYRKVRARDALRPVFGWPGVQTETVPAADWRKWRKTANLLHGDDWRAVPLASGDRLALYSVDSGGVPLDDVLNVAVTALLENEAARRARRAAVAFLNTLPENESLDPVTLERMKEALDLLAGTPKAGNVSTPRRKREDGAELDTTPKPTRPHKVATLLVSKPWHRTAMLDVLNRLHIPWERRSYGGWRTEPLTDVQMLQVTTALAFAVPGALVLSGALEAGSYAELGTPQPGTDGGKVYLNPHKALQDAHKHGRKVPRLERVALE